MAVRMGLQVVDDDQHVLLFLAHILLCHRQGRIGGKIRYGRFVVVEGGHHQGIVHGSPGSQLLIELLQHFLGLIDSHIDTEHVPSLLVHDGVQGNLGLACLLISDDQLTLSEADGIDQVDTRDTRIKRTVYRTTLHDGDRLCLDGDFFQIRELLAHQQIRSEDIGHVADGLGAIQGAEGLPGGYDLVAHINI